jgi:hypothetical protein
MGDGPVKFLLLLSDDPQAGTRPVAEQERVMAGHREVAAALRAEGRLVDSYRLRPAAEAVTVRGRDRVVVDGPFAEAKECVGGLYLVECDSLDQAVDWAKRLPLSDGLTIEVRPARTGAQGRRAVTGRRFIVMLASSEDSQATFSRAEIFRVIDDHYELSLELAVEGRFVASRSLDAPAHAVRLRRANGAYLTHDGPFAETKEAVLGYFVVACDTRADAVEVAKRLMGGSDAAEVRPIWDA